MTFNFTRQLGSQSGVQLNALRDNSEALLVGGNADQVFAIAMRATRGRIDKPFAVNASNFKRTLGSGESIRASDLNEAHIQLFEALNSGAYAAIVSRITTAGAKLSYIIATLDNTGNVVFSVSDTVPATPFMLCIRHLECFNDGLMVEVRCAKLLQEGAPIANDMIQLALRDAKGAMLYEFTGSLTPKLDDSGKSQFISDVVERSTENVVVVVGAQVGIPATSNAYGRDANSIDKVAKSAVLSYFDEGGLAFATADYQRAVAALKSTPLNFAYLATGGNQSPALITALVQLAFDGNKNLRIDLDGRLSPSAAITQLTQLNIDSHYVQAFWSPLKSDDPLGLNGKVMLGTSAYHIAQSCYRNSQTNAKGFAPKNYAVAGKNFPLGRTGITQIYTPTEQELSDLAEAKINPVISQTYSGGSSYVFLDSLTCAKVSNSFKKLATVAEMSSSIDDYVTRFSKEVLQLPMAMAIKKTNDFLKQLFESAESSGWLVPSAELGGASFAFVAAPNQASPVDKMDVSYSLRYDGTVRQIVVSQTLSR